MTAISEVLPRRSPCWVDREHASQNQCDEHFTSVLLFVLVHVLLRLGELTRAVIRGHPRS